MKNISIKVRLMLLSGMLILAIVIIGFSGLGGMESLNSSQEYTYTHHIVPIRELTVIKDMYAVNIVDTAHKVRNQNITWEQGIKNLIEAEKVVHEKWDDYLKTELTQREKDLIKQIKPLLNDADTSVIKLKKIFTNRSVYELDRYTIDELYSKIDPISDKFGELMNLQLNIVNENFEDNKTNYSILFYIILVTIVVVLVLTVVFSFFIIRGITVPVNKAVRIFSRISSGDMTVRIESDSKDEIGLLMGNMKEMLNKITRIISEIQNGFKGLLEASGEISSTSESLSQGANEQAASVEETSASVEEITAGIKQNAENARITNEIASKSASMAESGGKAVEETVSAMKEIAEKVSIIEEISAQTNLLAVNAAIEAARAGEHGEGFTVVASQVNKLADGSKAAAKEVHALSSSSVQVAINAGNLLNEIVPNIKKTADLIQEISAASQEQDNGISQINHTVEQLGQVAQQNASISEELAATSQEMNSQLQSLMQTISFFKIDEDYNYLKEKVHEKSPSSNQKRTTKKKRKKVKSKVAPTPTRSNGRESEEELY